MHILQHPPEWLLSFASFAITYFVHGTLIVAGVWAVCRFAPRLQLSTQNFLWKLALSGALLTSTVSLSLGSSELRPVFELGFLAPPHGRASVADEPNFAPGVQLAASDGFESAQPGHSEVVPACSRAVVPAIAALPAEPMGPDSTAWSVPALGESPSPWRAWPWALLAVFTVMVLRASVDLFNRVRALRHRLADRRDVLEDPALEIFLGILSQAKITRKVRLTASSHIVSPVAIGRHEVCVPERALAELDARQLRGVLGHELAHLQRRDPQWLIFATLLETAFPLQPLTKLARRNMQETAEMLCDDWALRFSTQGIDLAKSLARVAQWHVRQRDTELLPASVGSTGPLVKRVERLLASGQARLRQSAGVWAWGLGLTTLALIVGFAPAAVTAREPDAPAPTAKGADERVSAKQAPAAEHADQRSLERAERREQRELERAQRKLDRATRDMEKARDRAIAEHREVEAKRRDQGLAARPLPNVLVAPAGPTPPMPPMPPMPPIPVVGDVVGAVVGEVLPHVAEGTTKITILAKRYEEREASFRAADKRLASAQRRGAPAGELKRLTLERDQARASKQRAQDQLEAETKRFEAHMEKWGRGFEKRMEGWAQQWEAKGGAEKLEAWGEEMEAWAQELERAIGEDMDDKVDPRREAIIDRRRDRERRRDRRHKRRDRSRDRDTASHGCASDSGCSDGEIIEISHDADQRPKRSSSGPIML